MTGARPAIAVLAFGNFVVACAVMVVPGMLDQLAADLHVSVPAAGQLLSLAALALCLGAPSLAALTSRVDRRRLLLLSLLCTPLNILFCWKAVLPLPACRVYLQRVMSPTRCIARRLLRPVLVAWRHWMPKNFSIKNIRKEH